MRNVAWLVGGMVLASAAFAAWSLRTRPEPTTPRTVQFQRLTDFVGMEESPAISPDGKTVAFIAQGGGTRQIWLRLLAGGAPLQITHDAADHEQPRWAPDSSSLIYYSSSATGEQGTLWEISALGGAPRRISTALSGGDISHDGQRIAIFRLEDGLVQLVIVARDGSRVERALPVSTNGSYESPRWSPDDQWLAFQRKGVAFDGRLLVTSATGGEPTEIVRASDVRGLVWLPDGSGLVYSSAAGSTVLYPPTFNLRFIGRDGTGDRPLTFGDVSYLQPDVHVSGMVVASRVRIQSDIWKFPVAGSPSENTQGSIRITRQTGQAQTPSVSPDDSEVVYLSDSGGHGNLWVTSKDGSGTRQITFERDPNVSVGVPRWSPAGNQIVFIVTKAANTSLWLVTSDGSGLRELVPSGVAANWSGDGRWLYYSVSRTGGRCIEKVPVVGGSPVSVRCDNAIAPAVTQDGSMLYYLIQSEGSGYELRRARPEAGPSDVLVRVPDWRVPDPRILVPYLAPDGKRIAMPLVDGSTSNIWVLPTDGGPMRPVTDFGRRAVVIARALAWSPDSRFVYAAVAETDGDIVSLEGLLR